MKVQRILSVLLTICLLMGMMPASAFAEGEKLYACSGIYGEGDSYELDTRWPQESLTYNLGGREEFLFFFAAREDIQSGSVSPLEVTTVTSGDTKVAVVTASEEHEGFWQIDFCGLGETTLTVATSSASYEMPVSVTLPLEGFSLDTSITVDTYIASREIDVAEISTVYYVQDGDRYIPADASLSATVRGDDAGDLVKMSLINIGSIVLDDGSTADKYAVKVELSKDIEDDSFLNIRVGMKDIWGRVDYRRDDLRILNTSPRLYACSVWNDGESVSLDREWPRGNFNYILGSSVEVGFFYASSKDIQSGDADPLAAASVTSADSAVAAVSASERHPGFWRIDFCSLGETTLTVTTASDSYEMPVNVSLPSEAFCTSTAITEESFILNEYGCKAGDVFYFVVDDSYGNYLGNNAAPKIFVNGGNASAYFDIELVNANKQVTLRNGTNADTYYIQIKVKEIPSGWVDLNYIVNSSGGESWENGRGIELCDTEEKLQLFNYWTDDQGIVHYEAIGSTFYGNPNAKSGWMRLAYGNAAEYEFIDTADVVSFESGDPSVAEVIFNKAGNSKDYDHYQFIYNDLGETDITFVYKDASGEEAEGQFHVVVEMPHDAFFTKPEYDPAFLIPEECKPENCSNYNDEQCVWMLCEDGYEFADLKNFRFIVTYWDGDETEYVIEPYFVERETSGLYDIAVPLTSIKVNTDCDLRCWYEGEDGSWRMGCWVHNQPEGNAVYFTYGDTEFACGFGWMEGDGSALVINEGNWEMALGSFSGEKNEEEVIIEEWGRDIPVYIGKAKVDAAGATYYDVSEAESCGLQLRVTDLWYEVLTGDEDSFSFSNEEMVPELIAGDGEDLNNSVIYTRENYIAFITVWGTVEITDADGALVYSGDISILGRSNPSQHDVLNRPEDDTVEALNADLADFFENYDYQDGSDASVDVYLGNHYEGIIEIPEHDGRIWLTLWGNNTDVYGGVDLGNSYTQFLHINFYADERFAEGSSNDFTRAAFGGDATFSFCGFTGYSIALDGCDDFISCNGCVFYDNEVAVNVDIQYDMDGTNRTDLDRNLFVKNGTAIQILSLNDFISPYYLRYYENNFISNVNDIDLQAPGTVYFYRNYFGEAVGEISIDWAYSLHDAMAMSEFEGDYSSFDDLVTLRPAIYTEGDDSELVCNPRWAYPVFREDYGNCDIFPSVPLVLNSAMLTLCSLTEEAATNFLTVDWENTSRIQNAEADSLIISPSAFDGDGEKVIELADQDENLLGVWTFTGDFAEATEDFNAGIEIAEDTDTMTVTVNDSDVLSSGTVTLSVPCAMAVDWESVQVTDASGTQVTCSFSAEAGMVTFAVAAGGTYTIAELIEEPEEKPEEEPEADDDSDVTPVAVPEEPVNYAEIADETFTDVKEADWDATAIGYCAANELFAGYPDGNFKPAETVTRAMVVTVLAKLEGAELTAIEGKPWYQVFVDWAVGEGITDGSNPEKVITREQLIVMMWNLSGKPGSTFDLGAYGDAASIDAWALPAVRWAVENGLISGKTGNRIDPLGSASRAELAQIMYNYCEMTEKTENEAK